MAEKQKGTREESPPEVTTSPPQAPPEIFGSGSPKACEPQEPDGWQDVKFSHLVRNPSPVALIAEANLKHLSPAGSGKH